MSGAQGTPVEALFLEGANAFGAVILTFASVFFANVAINLSGGVRGIPELIRGSVARFWGGFPTSWRDCALALSGLFGAEAVFRWSIWAWRHFNIPLQLAVLTIALIILSLTTMCILRVFSPQVQTNRRWWLVFMIAAAFAIVSVVVQAYT